MPKVPFLERVRSGVPVTNEVGQRNSTAIPLLGDGAMGTLLHQRGVRFDQAFESLNLSHPQMVEAVHRDYIAAGADLIETNTFGANRYKLGEHGLQDQVVEVNWCAVELAQQAVAESGREVYIAGSVGPLGVRLKPYGRLKPEEARAAFKEQIGALAQAGVDVILFETFSDHLEMLEALAAAREVAPEVPVICHMTYAPDDRTLLGYLPGRVARELHDAGADIIGVNCSGGPAQLSRVLQMMRAAVPDALCSAMPNAGFPESVGGRVMYPATVEYFADAALTFKAIGACIIGGCCGTTPEHIAAMRAALDDPSRPLPHIQIVETHIDEDRQVPERPTELSHKLASGKFVVSVEMAPPRAYTVHKLLESARLLQDAGADVINVADTPTARMRMSAWAICHLLQSQLGMETVLHFPTRGRNLLRVQGDLLGAHALGLRNLFVVMGDPTHIGDYPEAMDNYDVSPSGLIKLIKQRMNMGTDQAGNSIGQATTFTVGCALNMCADDLDHEIAVLRKKLEAGADFALSQAVFDPAAIERFHRRYEEIEGKPFTLPVLMGTMPLYSPKHALFLHNEVPGISIPNTILKRMADAGEDAPQEGVRIAQELLRSMKELVQGAYLIPAYGHYELAADVIDAVKVPGVS
jgi:homocysteine S-methyltransferase